MTQNILTQFKRKRTLEDWEIRDVLLSCVGEETEKNKKARTANRSTF